MVRKKAVMALLRFFLLSPTSVDHLHEKVRRALCDADPSVMSATLNLLEYLVEVHPLISIQAGCRHKLRLKNKG